ncbi:hypothetical protein EDC01DRAFT_760359 [Geopyxis carbonaria]|nr:hypothetical protein EDC01DRAFT_760359 [Geopyxis carbonaria]
MSNSQSSTYRTHDDEGKPIKLVHRKLIAKPEDIARRRAEYDAYVMKVQERNYNARMAALRDGAALDTNDVMADSEAERTPLGGKDKNAPVVLPQAGKTTGQAQGGQAHPGPATEKHSVALQSSVLEGCKVHKTSSHADAQSRIGNSSTGLHITDKLEKSKTANPPVQRRPTEEDRRTSTADGTGGKAATVTDRRGAEMPGNYSDTPAASRPHRTKVQSSNTSDLRQTNTDVPTTHQTSRTRFRHRNNKADLSRAPATPPENNDRRTAATADSTYIDDSPPSPVTFIEFRLPTPMRHPTGATSRIPVASSPPSTPSPVATAPFRHASEHAAAAALEAHRKSLWRQAEVRRENAAKQNKHTGNKEHEGKEVKKSSDGSQRMGSVAAGQPSSSSIAARLKVGKRVDPGSDA